MTSLMQALQGHLNPALMSTAAEKLHESEPAVAGALGALVPVIMGGLLGKTKDPDALEAMFGLLNRPENAGFLDRLGKLVGGGNLAQGDPKDAAGGLMAVVFGDKVPAILSGVAGFASLTHKESAGHLLGMAGPLVMGVLGNRIAEGKLDPAGLKDLLVREADSILAAVPKRLASRAGIALPPVDLTRHDGAAPQGDPKGNPGWLVWLLPLAGIVLLAWFALRGVRDAPVTPAEPAEAEAPEGAH